MSAFVWLRSVRSFRRLVNSLAELSTSSGRCFQTVHRLRESDSRFVETETLEAFAATKATLAVHLSIHVLADVVARLLPFYGADCPTAVVFRASWPDEMVIKATLSTIVDASADAHLERTALILVGEALGRDDFRESALYDPNYQRRYRGRGE